jgi:exopolysaccharide biosynthesis polyprenyl glycosylphosphotransferase
MKDRMFLYWSLRNAGVSLRILSLDLETFYRRSKILMLGGTPTIKFSPPLVTGFDFLVKRCFDFVVSVFLIILISPILLAIAIIVKLDSPGPFFYKQERVGLHGRRFKALKFRTMYINADQLQKELEARNEMQDGVLFKMKDDPRITKVGKFLRRSSLDELPQLFNVLLGEMSLVGPRPLPLRDVQKFSEHHFIRQEVLPGITGLWQVSGRSNITSFEEVVRLDTFYIENWSIWLDMQILLRTALVLLQKKGAY